MKKMKVLFSSLLTVAVLLFFAQPGIAKSNLSFGLKLGGGLNYMLLTDYNNYVDDWNTYLENEPDTFTGSFDNLHMGMNFGGEFILYFTPNIGIGIGAGFLSASVDQPQVEYSFSGWLSTWYKVNQEAKVSAIPVRLTFHYTTPVSNFMNFFFNAGVGYYLGSLEWTDDGSAWLFGAYSTSAEASMTTIGFHGGLGLEFKFSPAISFFIEVQGQYAKFSEVTGDYTNTNIFGTTAEERTLYHYVWAPDNTTELVWATAPPSGTNYTDVREAAIDLTGAYFGGGFVFRFGGK